jgi:hypothetical protein
MRRIIPNRHKWTQQMNAVPLSLPMTARLHQPQANMRIVRHMLCKASTSAITHSSLQRKLTTPNHHSSSSNHILRRRRRRHKTLHLCLSKRALTNRTWLTEHRREVEQRRRIRVDNNTMLIHHHLRDTKGHTGIPCHPTKRPLHTPFSLINRPLCHQ